jgi:hypothetical protein
MTIRAYGLKPETEGEVSGRVFLSLRNAPEPAAMRQVDELNRTQA